MKDNYGQAGRLTAALATYRQLPRSLMSPLSRRLIFAPVTVRTRMLYGTDDGCIGPELFQHQQQRFTQPLDLIAMAGTGHFMQWERPDEFARLVLDFLAQQGPSTPTL